LSRNRKYRLIGVATLIILLHMPPDSLQSKDCPGPNKDHHADGTYDFTYESWVKKPAKSDHHDFGRCVQNKLTSIEMFVDWKGPVLKGFAKPNDSVFTEIQSPDSKFVVKNSDLWYGSSPFKMNAPYREVATSQQPKTERPQEHKDTSLRSMIHMAIPTDITRAAETLVSVDAEFYADVSPSPTQEAFIYKYGWRDFLTDPRGPISFRWQSASVERGMREKNIEELRLQNEPREIIIIDRSIPAYAITIVEFLDRSNMVVGSAPVAIYYPSEFKP
jgi:hypothetical protein